MRRGRLNPRRRRSSASPRTTRSLPAANPSDSPSSVHRVHHAVALPCSNLLRALRNQSEISVIFDAAVADTVFVGVGVSLAAIAWTMSIRHRVQMLPSPITQSTTFEDALQVPDKQRRRPGTLD